MSFIVLSAEIPERHYGMAKKKKKSEITTMPLQ